MPLGPDCGWSEIVPLSAEPQLCNIRTSSCKNFLLGKLLKNSGGIKAKQTGSTNGKREGGSAFES